MANKKIEIGKLFVPNDAFAILIVLIGLFIAIFLDETAIRLIGGSVAILGALALFMFIQQRIADDVEIKTPQDMPPPPNFSITVRKDTSAKRQVISNFDSYFGSESDLNLLPKDPPQKDFMRTDEGFKIIRRDKNLATSKLKPEHDNKKAVEQLELNKIKIIERRSSQKEDQPVESVTENVVTNNSEIEQHDLVNNMDLKDELLNSFSSEHTVEQPSEDNLFSSSNIIPTENGSDDQIIETDSQPQMQEPKDNLQDNTIDKSELILNEIQESVQVIPHIIQSEKIKINEIESSKSDYKKKICDVPQSMIAEELPFLSEEPKKELEYFLARVLMGIRSIIKVRTAAFILVNIEKQQLRLESFVSDIEDAVCAKLRFNLGNDVISQIIIHGQPEILTEINPVAELDLIPYYKVSVSTSSFVGVPVFYKSSVIGVLCTDTDIVDAFDSYTVSFLGHFTKLISAMIHSYSEKFDLLQASKTLNAINYFRSMILSPDINVDSIIESIVDTVSNIVDYSTVGLCVFDNEMNDWAVKALRTKENISKVIFETPVDLNSCLLGKTIMTGESILTSIASGYCRAHFEELSKSDGTFVSVPLRSGSSIFGAIYLEATANQVITENDLHTLETLGEHAGLSIERMNMISEFQNSAIYDSALGALNEPAFYSRMEEEFVRSSDFKIPITLLLFKIDKYQSLDPSIYRDRSDRMKRHVLEIIHKYLKPYDFIGDCGDEKLGLVLIGMKLEKAQIFAKKLRQEIASLPLHFENRSFSVTVSVGIAESSKADSAHILSEHAEKVLQISMERTNWVTAFS